MLGRETRVPDHLTYHVPDLQSAVHKYLKELVGRMRAVHEILREKQWQVHNEDSDKVGDWIWMIVTVDAADSRLSYSPSSWASTV